MTEAEAKNKWCPMVRSDVYPDSARITVGNRGRDSAGDDLLHPCIGSLCMMWRWDGEYKATKAGPIRAGDGEHGHCGLAGRP